MSPTTKLLSLLVSPTAALKYSHSLVGHTTRGPVHNWKEKKRIIRHTGIMVQTLKLCKAFLVVDKNCQIIL